MREGSDRGCVMGDRQDGRWTGGAGEIFGVRRGEVGVVVLGDGRRGGGGALLGVGARGWRASRERGASSLTKRWWLSFSTSKQY